MDLSQQQSSAACLLILRFALHTHLCAVLCDHNPAHAPYLQEAAMGLHHMPSFAKELHPSFSSRARHMGLANLCQVQSTVMVLCARCLAHQFKKLRVEDSILNPLPTLHESMMKCHCCCIKAPRALECLFIIQYCLQWFQCLAAVRNLASCLEVFAQPSCIVCGREYPCAS